ncbi:MAG: hypothetical protein KFH87_06215 [Bacteroidetes bacterium]|nr:hypothetical protein [Bacteroidota bacterium]
MRFIPGSPHVAINQSMIPALILAITSAQAEYISKQFSPGGSHRRRI